MHNASAQSYEGRDVLRKSTKSDTLRNPGAWPQSAAGESAPVTIGTSPKLTGGDIIGCGLIKRWTARNNISQVRPTLNPGRVDVRAQSYDKRDRQKRLMGPISSPLFWGNFQ